MNEKSTLEYILNLIKDCPHLKEFEGLFAVVDVESLGENPQCYGIEPTPCDPVVKRFIGGSAKCQFQFIFASRELNAGNEQKLENNRFYENLEAWFREVSMKGLPAMREGYTPQKLEALSCGYAYDQTETRSQYQIQCRLLYIRE